MARKLTRRVARAMAAARKSFRGGRPVQPKPCPRCGAPCASTVQAAAHCVGRRCGSARKRRGWLPHGADGLRKT